MPADKLLIARLKSKDDKALSQLYGLYSGAIYGIIIRIVKNEATAQQLLQDTFLSVWNKIDLYNPSKGAFYTWMYRIARNKSLNELRKKNELIYTDNLGVYKIESTDLNLSDDLNLKGAILKLSNHHQQAIKLVYYNGYTHEEAHKEMNVPLGTFKSYIRQAIRELKSIYKALPTLLLVFFKK